MLEEDRKRRTVEDDGGSGAELLERVDDLVEVLLFGRTLVRDRDPVVVH